MKKLIRVLLFATLFILGFLCGTVFKEPDHGAYLISLAIAVWVFTPEKE